MVFSSLVFIFVFLPVVFILSRIIPDKKSMTGRNILLLISSLIFYAFGDPAALGIMIVSVVFNYVCGRLMDKPFKRAVLAVCCTVNIGLLFVFKYLSYIVGLAGGNAPDIVLPVGISFFTFQAMSYVIDCYRDPSVILKNILKLGLYISFFPQLIAGPVVRYHDVSRQIDSRSCTPALTAEGIRRFCFGLGKKVLIANAMALPADYVFSQSPAELPAFAAWAGAVCYALQIYFDFSGYSDMAIGLGKLFGFEFRENFNYPYISSSMTEFWRRWHISVSEWFKEYLYIPLGGNRKGKTRTILNKWAVFICTGIWHGANLTFLVWGIFHGFCLMIESLILPKDKEKPHKPLFAVFGRIYTLAAIIISFVIFRSDSISDAAAYICSMFTSGGSSDITSGLMLEFTPVFIIEFAVGVIFCAPVIDMKRADNSTVTMILSYTAAAAVFVLSSMKLLECGYNPFIYFRF